MAVAATERAVDMSILGVRLPFSSGAVCLGMGLGAFLPIGGGGTRFGCFLDGGGDANAGLATTFELFTTVTLDLGEVFLALGFAEPEDFLLVFLFSGFFFGTNEILLFKFTLPAQGQTNGCKTLSMMGVRLSFASPRKSTPLRGGRAVM